jgi:hypothetical protein
LHARGWPVHVIPYIMSRRTRMYHP